MKVEKNDWPSILKAIDAKMHNVDYGWLDVDGKKHTSMDEYALKYRLQGPESLLASRLGVCWDQVELERKIAMEEPNVAVRALLLVYHGDENYPSHTVILLGVQGKVYYYEHAWGTHRGVWVFDNYSEAMQFVVSEWLHEMDEKQKWDIDQLAVYEYAAVPNGLTPDEFYKHCESGKRLDIKRIIQKIEAKNC